MVWLLLSLNVPQVTPGDGVDEGPHLEDVVRSFGAEHLLDVGSKVAVAVFADQVLAHQIVGHLRVFEVLQAQDYETGETTGLVLEFIHVSSEIHPTFKRRRGTL